MGRGGKSRLQAPPLPEEIEEIASSKEFVVDTSVLFYLQRVGLLTRFVEEYRVVIPESVRVESLRKDCGGDARIIAGLIDNGKIRVEKEYDFFPGEEAVLKLAIDRDLPVITDDGEMVDRLIAMKRKFTSSPMIPVMLYLKGNISFEVMKAKVEEILSIGYYGRNVKDFMGKVIKIISGGKGD